ncbi:Eukaryotic translation initiation factor 2-alpha kinase 2 [Trypanosoma cruzi]|uniref:non-specific serine/threonine protein kinase n=1 Tax=Trypanosoma cruzi TaxID=5693 RepID=A0A2V2X587_TRYCR|nr:Eukaryotic translation initiation factor 2-alpha kinase 2 [Trypanosoma cruzi]
MPDASIRIGLLILCILTLGLSFGVGSTTLLSVSGDQAHAQDANLLKNVETESAGDEISASRPDNKELVPSYRLHPSNRLLLLHKDGKISSYGLDNGVPMWTVDTGGDMLRVEIEKHPTERVIRQDPLALPFLLEGGMLFTRRCVAPFGCKKQMPERCFDRKGIEVETRPEARPGEAKTRSGSGDSCEIPFSSTHPRCFMNLSTLIEKKHVQVGETDIFVTTSAHIMDVDSNDGKPVPETNSLFSYLHVVRYDFTVHVRRPGEYSWHMSIAQYKLSEKSPLQSSEENLSDHDPLFVSRVLQSLLQKGDCGDNEYVPSTNEENTVDKVNIEPVVEEGSHNDIRNKQLMIREVDRNTYVLWSELKHAPVWSSVVNPLSTVMSAFVWFSDRGKVHSLPVYRLETPRSIADTVEILEPENTDSLYLPSSLNSDQHRSKMSFNLHGFPNTWEFDIVADELELRELQNLYQQCSWIHGCDGSSGNIPNHSPNQRNPGMSSQMSLVSRFPLSHTDTGNTLLLLFNVSCYVVSFLSAFLAVLFRWYLWNTTGVGPDAFVDRISNSSRPGSIKMNPLDPKISASQSVKSIDSAYKELKASHATEGGRSFDSITPLAEAEMLPPSTVNVVGTKSMHHVDSWWRYSGDDEFSISDKPSSECRIQPNSTVSSQLFQQQFQKPEKIGSGAEGSVFRVKHQFTGVSYAVKAIRIPDDNEIYIQEAVLHSTFDSVNVVRFFNAWIERVPRNFAETLGILHRDDTMDNISAETLESFHETPFTESASSDACYTVLFIQTEWFERGTLADHFVRRKGFTRLENLKHLLQISEGLQYLHSQCVVHCDLKPRNIFMSDSGIMKIGDFGLSRKNRKRPHKLRGDADGFTSNSEAGDEGHAIAAFTPLYCSPEQKRGDAATTASDIYSLGLIALEFYCVFTTQHERFCTLGEARQGVFPKEFADTYPVERALFQKMLSEDESCRPLMKDIVKALRQGIKEEEEVMDGLIMRSKTLSPIDEYESSNPASPLEKFKEKGKLTRVAPKFTRLSLSSLESTEFTQNT